MGRRLRSVAGAIGFPLLIAAVVALVLLYKEPLWNIFSNPEAVRAWVSGWGARAPLVFFLSQVSQVVLFVIPGEIVQIAGGYLFGFWWGSALTMGGITLGSIVNFSVGRTLGRGFLSHLFSKERLDTVTGIVTGPKGQVGFFLLFLIPGLPKDILCYVGGMASFRVIPFLLISMAGRLPGILGSALMGSSAADQRWWLSIGLFAGSTLLFGLGLVFQKRIQNWLEARTANKETGGGE
jgi:uncharacterized membrane protein YdjX (TVP38/TMEM64 family)